MNSSNEFNGHVYIKDLEAAQLECNPIWDKTLGTSFIVCTLIGVPANVMALGYFLSKKKRDLPNKLYISICCIDFCTGLTPPPLAVSLTVPAILYCSTTQCSVQLGTQFLFPFTKFQCFLWCCLVLPDILLSLFR